MNLRVHKQVMKVYSARIVADEVALVDLHSCVHPPPLFATPRVQRPYTALPRR